MLNEKYPVYDEITGNYYRSNEEMHFAWYCQELVEKKILFSFSYESNKIYFTHDVNITYEKIKHLKKGDKISIEEAHLMNPLTYTADFILEWDDATREQWKNLSLIGLTKQYTLADDNTIKIIGGPYSVNPLRETQFLVHQEEQRSFVDVKGSFAGSFHSDEIFPIKQKLFWKETKFYLQKIVPVELFQKTFTPERYLRTDKGMRERMIKFTPRMIEDYLIFHKNDFNASKRRVV